MFKTLLMAAVVSAGLMFAATPQAEAGWGRRYRPRPVNVRKVYRPPVSVYRAPRYYGGVYGPNVYRYRSYRPGYYGGYGAPGIYGRVGYGPGISFGIGF
ncbi:hypothetical protein [Blastopirellula marina]|uniref:Uncharacterized protein n=1 Tax=Blastopirellula marina TaxID=124 RepID=A0A2S8GMP5_9BACT|nr:hypothetical protein [Blastopirellula marina]PQO45631.1 hypothetical protein C5Y93_14440 [Blastopirellula marina]